ncbi:MAG: lysylphosphatidylglycerol synthase transmembrane domain-containing protein [Candidatus Eisenbacteria bacterium]|nr:lysylphosphatidylglycerol synthase transmembrane domain-containing protein [Candidatus Eisenbacteria bacterium]
MKRRAVILFGILLSAVFLYAAARGAKLDRMLAILSHARYGYTIPCVILTLFAFWIRALRWGLLLRGVRRLPQPTLFSATMIGFLANNVLPARLGELVRAHVVGRRGEISRSAALASIVVERIFDLFTMLGLFAVVMATTSFPGGLEKVAIAVLGVGLVSLVLLLLWNRYPGRFVGIVLPLVPARLREKTEAMAERFRTGLLVFNNVPHLIAVAGYSILMWAAIVVVMWLVMISLAIHVPQPQASMVALVAIALVTMIPSAPGFIGTLQGGGTAALVVFGVSRESGLAFSILYHATQWIPVNVVGLIYLFREGLSLGQLSRMAESSAESDPAARSQR